MEIKYIRVRGNAYFDTYYLHVEGIGYIGIIEHHCRQVKSNYFVAWAGNPCIKKTFKTGEVKPFYDKDAAEKFIVDNLIM